MKASFKHLFAFILGILSLSAVLQAATEGTVLVLDTKGQVVVKNDASGRELPLAKGQELTQGYSVQTKGQGACLLSFSNGALVHLEGDSVLQVKTYTVAASGASSTELFLAEGELVGKIKGLDATNSDFKIKTPLSETVITGTIFQVSHDPNTNTTTVTNIDGSVVVYNSKGDTFKLEASQSVSIDPQSGAKRTRMSASQINQIISGIPGIDPSVPLPSNLNIGPPIPPKPKGPIAPDFVGNPESAS